jgi:hypothetical protein
LLVKQEGAARVLNVNAIIASKGANVAVVFGWYSNPHPLHPEGIETGWDKDPEFLALASGLYTVNSPSHDPAELKAVALDIRNEAPEIYGLAIKLWTYFKCRRSSTAPVTGNHET